MMGYRAPSKKAIKDAVKGVEGSDARLVNFEARMQETSMFGPEYKGDGVYTVVGPDAYTSRKWYGQLTVKSGQVVKVA